MSVNPSSFEVPAQLFPNAARRRYIAAGLLRVEGWLDPLSARFILALHDAQTELGVIGSVGEIGVHHGKLFILLHLMLREGERSFAVDVFERQYLNVDQSGAGNRERFLANLAKWSGQLDRVEIIAESSESISPHRITELVGPVRIFSVDGGHTEALTINDLSIADQSLTQGGVVIIDDYFNPHWPDVSCGVGRYFRESTTELRPLLICPNKIFLCAADYVEEYEKFFLQTFRFAFLKKTIMFNSNVLVFDHVDKLPNRWKRHRIHIGNTLRRSSVFSAYKRFSQTTVGRSIAPFITRLFP